MKIYVIGVGLIGGSMALDLKAELKNCEITGIDTNIEYLEYSIKMGIIDKMGSIDTISEADRIILSIPVKESLQMLPSLLSKIHPNALIWDVGSTKEKLCKLIANHPKRDQFLAVHPIAGTEFSGPKAALKGLFIGKTQILCEANKTRPDLLKWAKRVFRQIGMHIHFMDPINHDEHVAYVSHLSHISSFMLGKTVLEKEEDESNIFDLAGSGFESTVRLAKSSPAMWTPIFEQNKDNVVESLNAYIKNLENFKDLLIQEDYKTLFQEMKNTNQLTSILNGIIKK